MEAMHTVGQGSHPSGWAPSTCAGEPTCFAIQGERRTSCERKRPRVRRQGLRTLSLLLSDQ